MFKPSKNWSGDTSFSYYITDNQNTAESTHKEARKYKDSLYLIVDGPSWEEAEANAAADKEKAANIETKNQADSICYQTKKQLEELESKIDASEKEKVESLLTKLQAAINTDDTDAMKSLTEEVKQLMMELGQKVYSQTDSTTTNSDGETIETDFSVGK